MNVSLSLYCSGHQTSDVIALQDEKNNNTGKGTDHNTGLKRVPVDRPILSLERTDQVDRKRVVIVIGEKNQRCKELVPGSKEGKESDRNHTRVGDRKHHAVKHGKRRTAIDQGRLL